MAPTTTKPRDTNFTDIGVAGRKTGITVKDTGQRDAFGMENMDDFFSPDVSPEKEFTGPNSSPAKIGSNGGTISIDETMDIDTSELPARIPSRASLPPRARSPIKTSLNTPPRRASSVGLSSPAHTQAPINRKLTFGKIGAPPVSESSPALPHSLLSAGWGPSADPPQSKDTTKSNGSSTLNTDKSQQKPGGQPLTQVTEESMLTSSPPELPAKKAPTKRGFLVSKKPAEPRVISLDDSDSGSEEVGSMGRGGVSVVLNSSGVVGEDTVIPETQEEPQEEVEEEEEAPVKKGKAAKQKAKAPPKKAAKAKEKEPMPQKSNGKSKGKKTVELEPEPEQESEPGPAPPVKPGRRKKAKAPEPEPEPEPEPTPVKPTRSKKAQTKVPEPEAELNPAPTKPTRGKKAAKAPELEAESDSALVKPTRRKKVAAMAPELEAESDSALVKPTRGKKAQAIKQTETEPVPAPVKPTRGKKAQAVKETEPEPTPPVKPLKGKKAASKALETETESEPTPKTKPAPKGRGKKAAKPIVESSEEPEREPTPPPKPVTKPLGKGRAKRAEPEQEPANQQEPPMKRTRTINEKSTAKLPAKPPAKAKGKAPAKPQKAKASSPEQSSNPKSQHTSSPQKPVIVKNGSQRTIKQPPPPPRATSEEPGAIRRSTRAHIAPLAYWKGEKLMYRLTAQHESSRSIALPTITEVIRVESDSEGEREKAGKRRKRPTAAGGKRKRPKLEGEDEDDLQEEEWESRVVDGEVGVVRGYVKTYHNPPIEEMLDEEEVEERELAFSRNRIVTVEVANGDFTFVKTCTEDFFGTGMVEIPPGGIKRTKNSGKMHLVFYVISGKVDIKIGDNEFRVRKGGQFMVPRGNLYSIENPYDFQAKMFFAQGCEKVIRAGSGSDNDGEMEG